SPSDQPPDFGTPGPPPDASRTESEKSFPDNPAGWRRPRSPRTAHNSGPGNSVPIGDRLPRPRRTAGTPAANEPPPAPVPRARRAELTRTGRRHQPWRGWHAGWLLPLSVLLPRRAAARFIDRSVANGRVRSWSTQSLAG